MMEAKFGFLVLLPIFLLVSSSSFARQMPSTLVDHENHVSVGMVLQMEQPLIGTGASELGNDQLCLLCEEYIAEALDYLADNETQTEIIELLHNSCSQLAPFKQQCVTLVDYYVPFFFLEISSIEPEKFCKKMNLCHQVVTVFSQAEKDSCGICHQAVAEVIVKLKDPDTQLDILEILLKGCGSMENYAAKCKKMVFEYGPIVIANTEKFLETTDICTLLHACNSKQHEPAGLVQEGSSSLI